MFGLGLEFSLHKMAEVGVPGFLSAGVQAVGMGGLGVLLGFAMGWGAMNSIFFGGHAGHVLHHDYHEEH